MKFKIIILFLFFSVGVQAEDVDREVVYVPQVAGSLERISYMLELLDAALQKTVKQHGFYELVVSHKVSRDEQLSDHLVSGEYDYSLGWVNNIKPISTKLLYIPIPIFRGTLGARVFHVKANYANEAASISNLENLKKVPIGVGASWEDAEIMRHAKMNLVTGQSHNDLTKMLSEEKVKMVTRSVYEASAEIPIIQKTYADIVLDKSILLYYKSDVFFAFPQKNEALKNRIEKGLNQLVREGEFEKIFNKYYKKNIDLANVSQRKVFTIETPYVVPGDYLLDKRLWISMGTAQK